MPYCAGVPYGKDGNCMPCMPSGYSTALCGSYDDDFMPLYCESDTTLGQGSAGWCVIFTAPAEKHVPRCGLTPPPPGDDNGTSARSEKESGLR
jgi:hypothetical protein